MIIKSSATFTKNYRTMVTITTFRDGNNDGAEIKKDGKQIGWEKLTRCEQIDLLNSMTSMYNFFKRFLKEE